MVIVVVTSLPFALRFSLLNVRSEGLYLRNQAFTHVGSFSQFIQGNFFTLSNFAQMLTNLHSNLFLYHRLPIYFRAHIQNYVFNICKSSLV